MFMLETEHPGDRLGEVNVLPLTPREAFIELLKSCYLLEIRAPETLRRQFDALAGITSAVPSFRLQYRHEYSLLPEVRQAVLRHIPGAA
jgi:hypothetical protein